MAKFLSTIIAGNLDLTQLRPHPYPTFWLKGFEHMLLRFTPQRNCLFERLFAEVCKPNVPYARVVGRNVFDQTPTNQDFEIACQCCAIYRERFGKITDARFAEPVERSQQRELRVAQSDRSQRTVIGFRS
jgi:hypothetical protein